MKVEIVPPTEREVMITITQRQAIILRLIIGHVSVSDVMNEALRPKVTKEEATAFLVLHSELYRITQD